RPGARPQGGLAARGPAVRTGGAARCGRRGTAGADRTAEVIRVDLHVVLWPGARFARRGVRGPGVLRVRAMRTAEPVLRMAARGRRQGFGVGEGRLCAKHSGNGRHYGCGQYSSHVGFSPRKRPPVSAESQSHTVAHRSLSVIMMGRSLGRPEGSYADRIVR